MTARKIQLKNNCVFIYTLINEQMGLAFSKEYATRNTTWR